MFAHTQLAIHSFFPVRVPCFSNNYGMAILCFNHGLFFFFFLNPNLYPAACAKKYRGGHVCYVVWLGIYGMFWKQCELVTGIDSDVLDS